MNNVQVEQALFDKAISDAFEILTQHRNDFEDSRAQVVVSLFATCTELARSINVLFQEDLHHNSRILIRSLMEAYVELAATIADPDHFQNSHLRFVRNTLFRLRSAKEGNPYFAELKKSLNLDQEIESWEQTLGELRELGATNPSIQETFDVLNMTHEYNSIYRSLSEDVHPRFEGFIRRHLEADDGTNRINFVMLRNIDDETKELLLSTASDYLCRACKAFSEYESEMK